MKKILIGSPVRQKNNILKEFLLSIEEVDLEGLEVTYYFVDDNTDPESTKLLKDFGKRHNLIYKVGKEIFKKHQELDYLCNDETHHWKRGLIEKITFYKDGIIQYAKDNDFDYLFLIDSDIVLSKPTIKHLISQNVDIVSNIFWSQWKPGEALTPQVWLQGDCARYIYDWDRPQSEYEKEQQLYDFITQFRVPGIYEVGGLGACTLISKKAVKAGVKFELIDTVPYWGEDKHFCIRAEAYGFKLYADSVYPAYHIYREEYLNRVDEFKRDGWKFDMCQTLGNPMPPLMSRVKIHIKELLKKIKYKLKQRQASKFARKRVTDNNKIVLSMIVHNEVGRYLERCLESAIKVVDEVLIIDDASTDNTVQICEDVLKDFPHKIIKNEVSLFNKEYKLRKFQWKETIKLNPGWILALDADEILEDDAKRIIDNLIKVDYVDVFYFKLFDMWNEEEYREDKYWNAHTKNIIPFLRYQPKFHYKFRKTNQHCGRVPKNIYKLRGVNFCLKIKHMGWASEKDRNFKYQRYMELDKDGKFGNMDKYKSILDKNPNLKKFEDYGKNFK